MKRRMTAIVLIGVVLEFFAAGAHGHGSMFVRVTGENQRQYGLRVRILPVLGQDDKYTIMLTTAPNPREYLRTCLIVCRDKVRPEEQDFRSYLWKEDRGREDILLMAPLLPRDFGRGVFSGHVEFVLDAFLLTKAYIYIDFPGPISDGGEYYCIDLATYPLPEARKMIVSYSAAKDLGPEQGVMRRDPSDINRTRELYYQGNSLKTDDTYYAWYTKSHVPHGYDATVWYATSADGRTWVEKGEALPRGPEDSWDAQSVFTPNILKAEDKYYLFYTGVPKPFTNKGNKVTKSAIGLAVADSPDGPWRKLATNPILTCSDDPAHFDSMRVDDACLIVRDGRYWLYYKGRQWDNTPANTMMGVAIAERPEGPYKKYAGNPVIRGGHEVLVWPLDTGVAALINIGPEGIRRTVQYAPDGLKFWKMMNLDQVPSAPGAYRPGAFRGKGEGKMIEWGLHIGRQEGFLPFLERFDCQWK